MIRYVTAALVALALAAGPASASAAAPASAETVQPSRGDITIAFWQDRLNTWLQLVGSDLFPIAVDGVFGPATEAATRQFQDTSPMLETTGVVTQLDRVVLEQAIARLIAFWQDRLNTWLQLVGSDLFPIAVDGIFGPATEAATRQFQDTSPRLETSGVVTQLDRVVLEETIAGLEAPETVQRSDRGITIGFWQDRLNTWLRLVGSDLPQLAVDGIFGPATEAATRQFQDTSPMLETTGVVTQLDRVVLEQTIARLEAMPELPPGGDITIAFWQDRLNTWLRLVGSDLFPIAVDGIFGPATEAATRQFQDTYPGVETTGVVTDLDRIALDQAIAHLEAGGQPPPPGGELAIAFWQDRLNTWLRLVGSDLFPIAVDGIFGPATEAATRQFQDTYPGVETTGMVTDLDRIALDQAIAHILAGGQPPPLGGGESIA